MFDLLVIQNMIAIAAQKLFSNSNVWPTSVHCLLLRAEVGDYLPASSWEDPGARCQPSISQFSFTDWTKKLGAGDSEDCKETFYEPKIHINIWDNDYETITMRQRLWDQDYDTRQDQKYRPSVSAWPCTTWCRENGIWDCLWLDVTELSHIFTPFLACWSTAVICFISGRRFVVAVGTPRAGGFGGMQGIGQAVG